MSEEGSTIHNEKVGLSTRVYASSAVSETCPVSSVIFKEDPSSNPHEHSQTPCALPASSTELVSVGWAKPHDPENPFDWSRARKWRLVSAAFYFTLCASTVATSYPVSLPLAAPELHTSDEVFLLGSTVYLVVLALGPMVLAPLSEVYGRRGVYIVGAVLFALFQIPLVLARNVEMLIVFRGLQGLAASIGNSVVGGSVADVFPPSERGLPMSVFALVAFVGSTLGPLVCGLVGPAAGWRWEFGWQLIMSGLNVVTIFLFCEETRHPVLLARRASRLTLETRILHRASAPGTSTAASSRRSEAKLDAFWTLTKTSLTRPFVYLFTEPIVTAISLWIGFAWGVFFLLIESVSIVFSQPGYDFTPTDIALVYGVTAVGGLLGFLGNLHQNSMYEHVRLGEGWFDRFGRGDGRIGRPKPEVRLIWACIGGLAFPAGMLWYAWTGRPSITPALPILALVTTNFGIFPIFLASYAYLADVYEHYASSALSAQSLLRNLFGAAFVLVAPKMYAQMGTAWASTLLGLVGVFLAVVPFGLMFWGERVRKSSKVACQIEREVAEGGVLTAPVSVSSPSRDAHSSVDSSSLDDAEV